MLEKKLKVGDSWIGGLGADENGGGGVGHREGRSGRRDQP